VLSSPGHLSCSQVILVWGTGASSSYPLEPNPELKGRYFTHDTYAGTLSSCPGPSRTATRST
jgi:hypothetical protein